MLNSTTPEWLTSARVKYAKKLENQNPKAFQTLEEINGSHDLVNIIKIDDPRRSQHIHENPVSCERSENIHTKQPFPVNEKPFTYTGQEDPDGLNERIIGKFEKLLKHDPHLLQARAWKIHPAKLTMLLKAGKHEAIKREVEFVAGNSSVSNPGAYLNVLLRKL